MKKIMFFFVVFSLSLISNSKVKAENIEQTLASVETYLQIQQTKHKSQGASLTLPQIQYLKILTEQFLPFCKNDQQKLNNLMLNACEKGLYNITLWTIQNGADVKYAKNLLNQAALHLAAKSGKINLLNVVLDKEGDLNAMDFWGKIPLEIAHDEANEDATAFLIQKMHECYCYHCQQDLGRLRINPQR